MCKAENNQALLFLTYPFIVIYCHLHLEGEAPVTPFFADLINFLCGIINADDVMHPIKIG